MYGGGLLQLAIHENFLLVSEVPEILNHIFVVDPVVVFEGRLPSVDLEVRGYLVK